MNIVSNIYDRIITTAHQIITNDDINNYNEDFSGMLYFKNPELYQKFHEISESIASILLQKKIGVFVMAYDTIAFCIRFHSNYSFSGINLRMISDSLHEIPNSSGDPIFLIGADDLACGFGWKPAQAYPPEEDAEIFPVIDFKGICIYYAVIKKRDSAQMTPQIFRSLNLPKNSLSYSSNSKKKKSEPFSESFILASQPPLNSSSNSNSESDSDLGFKPVIIEHHTPDEYYLKKNPSSRPNSQNNSLNQNEDKTECQTESNSFGFMQNKPNIFINQSENEYQTEYNESDNILHSRIRFLRHNEDEKEYKHDESNSSDPTFHSADRFFDQNEDDEFQQGSFQSAQRLSNSDKIEKEEEENDSIDNDEHEEEHNKMPSLNQAKAKLTRNSIFSLLKMAESCETDSDDNPSQSLSFLHHSRNQNQNQSESQNKNEEINESNLAQDHELLSLQHHSQNCESLSFQPSQNQNFSSNPEIELNYPNKDDGLQKEAQPISAFAISTSSSDSSSDSSFTSSNSLKHQPPNTNFSNPQNQQQRSYSESASSSGSNSTKVSPSSSVDQANPSNLLHFPNIPNQQRRQQSYSESASSSGSNSTKVSPSSSVDQANPSNLLNFPNIPNQQRQQQSYSESASSSGSNSTKVSPSSSADHANPLNLLHFSPAQQQQKKQQHSKAAKATKATATTSNRVLEKKRTAPLNLFDYSTTASSSASTSTSTSVLASSSTSMSASPSRNASPSAKKPLFASKNQPKREKSKKTSRDKASSKSARISQTGDKTQAKQKQLLIQFDTTSIAPVNFSPNNDKPQKKFMKQTKLPLKPKPSKQSTNTNTDEIHSKNHRLQQQQLRFDYNPKSNSTHQKHRLVQSKLPLVKDKKTTSNFSSDYFSEQSSTNSLSNSNSISNSNTNSNSTSSSKATNKTSQKLHQSTLPLTHQIKGKK